MFSKGPDFAQRHVVYVHAKRASLSAMRLQAAKRGASFAQPAERRRVRARPMSGRERLPPSAVDALVKALAEDRDLSIWFSTHAQEQMRDRDIVVSDLMHLLKHGIVGQEAEIEGGLAEHGYPLDGMTPNSGRRFIRAIVTVDPAAKSIGVITMMWVDEPNRDGSVMRERMG